MFKNTDSNETNQPTVSRAKKDDRMILALLQHPTVPKAAEALGVHPSTVWRRLQEPEFDKRLRQARREAYSQSMARLQQGTGAATATLLHIMADPTSPAHARVRAAECVLKLSQSNLDREDLLPRLKRVENELFRNEV